MDMQRSHKTIKWLALLSGLFLVILICGIRLVQMIIPGGFRRVTQPFTNAAQTVAVDPITTGVPFQLDPVDMTATGDISSLPFQERFDMAGQAISDAMNNSAQGHSAEAILSWSKVIEIIPEWDGGYYNRGLEYLKLLNNQRSQEEYLYSLSLAGKDFDKAIELDPSNGNYYYARFRYYDALSSNQTTRADTDHLENIALDNLLTANRLGNYQPNSDVKVALVYLAVGKCDEALDQANRLIARTNEPSVDMIGSLSIGYFCKNDTTNALKYMNNVVELVDGCQSRFDRARIFYAMGRLDDALTDLDITISKSPHYCGIRYYLRGLIYSEKGEFDKAQNDLDVGMRQTWERGGLLSYAQGKIALAHGDKESAIQYFQDAEVTYPLHDPILLKMREDLSALGASPLEVKITFPPATAIPTLMPQFTPQPTSSPISSLSTPAQ